MSTDLLGVRILDVDRPARRVRVRVFVVYYELEHGRHEPLPYDPSVFMRMLWHAARWHGGRCDEHDAVGLAAAVSLNEWTSEAWIDANTWRFIDRFDTVATRNTPLRDDATLADFHYLPEGSRRWPDEEKLVQGDYDVWLTEERWLDGLVVGTSFGTTAYNTLADTMDAALVDLLPDPQRPIATFILDDDGETSPRPVLLTASDDGRWLACGDEAGRLRVIDTETWSVCHDSDGHGTDDLSYAEFVPGEATLSLPGNRALTLPDGRVERSAHGLTSDGPLRCGGSGRARVARTYDERAGEFGWRLLRDGEVVLSSDAGLMSPRWSLSRDDRSFALIDGTRLELWDVEAKRCAHVIELPGDSQSAAFSPDGQLVLAGFCGDDCRGFGVYEVATGREVRRVTPAVSPSLEGEDGDPLGVALALWTERYVALAEERMTRTFDTLATSLRVVAASTKSCAPVSAAWGGSSTS